MRRETKMKRETKMRIETKISTSPPEFIAKQVPYPPDLFSKQELSVKTLWHDTQMMVSPTKRIVHFASPVPKSQSASPSHLKIEKFEDDLHLFGKFCPQSYKKSSQNEMLKILSLSPHLTSVHKSSAFCIAGTVWENRFSNLHHPDTNSCSTLLLLVCENVAFLMMYCDTLFVKSDTLALRNQVCSFFFGRVSLFTFNFRRRGQFGAQRSTSGGSRICRRVAQTFLSAVLC